MNKLYVIMYDPTQQVCPVLATSRDEAREKISVLLGQDVSDCPVYDSDDPEDIKMIVSIIANHVPNMGGDVP